MKYLSIGLMVLSASLTLSSTALAYRRVYVENPYYRNVDPYYRNTPRDSFYIAGDVGLGRLSTPDQVLDPVDGNWIVGASHNNESVAAGGTVGFQHAVNRQILVGAEAGYDYNGASKYTEDYIQNITWTESTTYRLSSQDIHLLATGTVLFPNGFNIFVKGGAARVDQKLRITNEVDYTNLPIYLGETSIVAYKPMAAAGLGFRFQAVEIYAQYARIFGENAENFQDLFDQNGFTDVVSVDTFKMGLAVHIRV
jgi:hypothetical protein